MFNQPQCPSGIFGQLPPPLAVWSWLWKRGEDAAVCGCPLRALASLPVTGGGGPPVAPPTHASRGQGFMVVKWTDEAEMANPLASWDSQGDSRDEAGWESDGSSPGRRSATFDVEGKPEGGASFDVEKRGSFDVEQRPSRPSSGDEEPVVAGRVLGLVGPDNPCRQALFKFVFRKEVEAFLLVCILINTVMLAVQTPQNTLGADINSYINTADVFMSAVFTLEMVGKVFALGLFIGPTSYLRSSSWNVLDFIVVAGIWLELLIKSLSGAGVSVDVSFLRTARAMRPLRSMRHFTGVKLIMTSLRRSVGLLAGVTGVLVISFGVFATVGIQLFSGAITLQCLATTDPRHYGHQLGIADEVRTPPYSTRLGRLPV